MQLRALRFETAGLRITIPRSKRDQEGLGQKVAIRVRLGALLRILR